MNHAGRQLKKNWLHRGFYLEVSSLPATTTVSWPERLAAAAALLVVAAAAQAAAAAAARTRVRIGITTTFFSKASNSSKNAPNA